MNIAVCDDDRLSRLIIQKNLEKFIHEYPQYELNIFMYDHADDLIEAAEKNGGFDIFILDVLMPDTDGIELGVMLREKKYDGKIIYLTSSEDYVFDSFKAEPFNYIIKPVDDKKLFPILAKALHSIADRYVKSIIVKTSTSNVRIPLENIVYTELFEHTIIYHMKDDKQIRSKTIRVSFSEAIRELLADSRFFLCGASIAVNMDHISEATDSSVSFNGGQALHFSKKIMTDMKSTWYEYCLDKQQNKL